MRERAGPYSADLAGSSSISPPASEARSSCVRRSDANAARPGSYGSETVTSARAGERLEQPPLRARSGPRTRTRTRAGRPTRRAPTRAVRPRGGGARRDPRGRAASSSSRYAVYRRARSPSTSAVERARSSSPASSSASTPSSASAKPAKRAERSSPASGVRASARRATSVRCVSPATGLASAGIARELAEEVVERPDRAGEQRADPPSAGLARPGRRPPRFGTIRTGSRSSAARYPSSRCAILPALAGPRTSARPIVPS